MEKKTNSTKTTKATIIQYKFHESKIYIKKKSIDNLTLNKKSIYEPMQYLSYTLTHTHTYYISRA